MTNAKKLVSVIGLLVLSFGFEAGHALAANKRAERLAQWGNLERLAHGKKIQVELTDGESFRGKFEGASPESLMIRLENRKGKQTISRQSIARVSAKGQGHRWRNTLGLAAVYGAAGFVLAKIQQSRQKKCPPDLPLGYPFCGRDSNGTVAVLALSEAGTGALLGALISNVGWHDVYRAVQ